MEMEQHPESSQETLRCRTPQLEDLAGICQRLNEAGARYIVVGGFAIVQAGYPRFTEDIDLLIETSIGNEEVVIQVLGELPDKAALQVRPGDVAEYGVVRIGDEVLIDLMKSGCGVTYEDAIKDAVWRDLQRVRIPFASRSTLWKMKQTLREKDAPDRLFLAKSLTDDGIPLDPPLKNLAPETATPAWVERFFSWLKGIRGT
jgi:hypothetical protein